MAGVGRAEGAEAMGREDGLEGGRYRACIQSVEYVEGRDVAIVQSTLKSVCTSDSVLVVARVGCSRRAVSEGASYRIVVGLEVARERARQRASEGGGDARRCRRRRCRWRRTGGY